uniref:Serine aminopeptidase S33 domain-containing protein n=1 Tax=Timema tahoe TaxID=61484 RepID=A0A7R9IIH3_9NEOP|nr:unnamed protein product [Timema tahoe]
MLCLPRHRSIRRILLGSLKTTIFALVVIFGVVPIIFRYTYPIQRSLIFLNFVNYPALTQFQTPQKYGLKGTRNFHITTDESIRLGIWHVLPSKFHNSSEIEEEGFFLTALGSGDPVVVYMHGNSGSRASTHRIELYQLLSNLGYHVIAFDYRSYGDSTNESPSEQGVVSDSLFVLSWTVERVKGAPLFVWGHSLGTSVSSHSLDILSQKGLHPTGLILEAPFNNMRDEIREHPLARVFRFLPWFDFCFADSVGENNLLFETDKHLRNIRSRVLILHAEDDKIIPFKLAKKLYESTVQGRSPHFGKVKFVKFEGKWGHGHKWICRSPDLPNVIRYLFILYTLT